MISMTGYGSAKIETDSSVLEVNVKTVNGRYLESRVHLPRELSFIETELKKDLSKYFQRGTVDIYISRKAEGVQSQVNVLLHEKTAKQWIEASKILNKKFKIKGSLDIATLLQLPEVVSLEESQDSIHEDAKHVKKLLQKACGHCNKERQREGEALQTELHKILNELKTICGELSSYREQANASLKNRFETKVLSRATELQLDQNRLYQEVVIMLEKSDIQEELTRLNEHFNHIEQLFKAEGSQGKKLDFYSQELLREMNTIGSKSQISDMTRLVVQAKTLIDKLKEQVQNIE